MIRPLQLYGLRKHMQEFEFHAGKHPNHRHMIWPCETQRDSDPGDYDMIRNASQALHKTLTTAWYCSQVTHLNHSAKLFVNSKVDHGVSLDRVIFSESLCVDIKPSNTLHLSIRSYSQTYLDKNCPSHALHGPRYHEIVKWCLEYHFGFGADVQKPQLQTAVDDDVLVGLSAMIAMLDISREH
ncbi:hypothetical protein BDW59DRAFT_157369 [Aspergillus cavernicola]|uniref:Uncharacterized protein n=1 Tax=Aspergillus cavernicola TaxID=176166 RepID=A0ABR4IXP8_9EURO